MRSVSEFGVNSDLNFPSEDVLVALSTTICIVLFWLYMCLYDKELFRQAQEMDVEVRQIAV